MKSGIEISLRGLNLDLVISKLQSNNIVCYDLQKPSYNNMVFRISVKNLKQAKQIIKEYNYNIKYLGIAKIKKSIIHNIAVFFVLPFVVAGGLISTKFIWKINVYGGDSTLQYEVIQVLNKNSIRVGSKFKLSNTEIEHILLDQLPSIAQVSCIRKGTNLIINISKKLVYQPAIYEPIRAKYSGVITDINLIAGTINVNIGEFVTEGDILVLPYNYNKQGELVPVKPIAEINAKTYITERCILEAETSVLSRSGREYTTSSIKLCNRNLFSKKVVKPFDIYELSVYNENISDVLPLVRQTTTYYELVPEIKTYDLNAEKQGLLDKSYNLACSKLPTNCEVLDKSSSSVIVDNVLYCTSTLTVLTNIT